MVAEADDPNIPTLTDVVKLGNPSLIISGTSLQTPAAVEEVPDVQELASSSAEHAEVFEPDEHELTDVQEESEDAQAGDYIALDLFEKADLEDEQTVDQPTMALDIIKPIIEEDDASNESLSEKPQHESIDEGDSARESTEVATGIDLSSELAEGFTPADTMTVDFDDLGIPTMLQAELGLIETPTRGAGTETEPASDVGEQPPVDAHHDEIDPETVMMALEAPISGILQQHMQQARSEIQALIRQEIENQQKHLKH